VVVHESERVQRIGRRREVGPVLISKVGRIVRVHALKRVAYPGYEAIKVSVGAVGVENHREIHFGS